MRAMRVMQAMLHILERRQILSREENSQMRQCALSDTFYKSRRRQCEQRDKNLRRQRELCDTFYKGDNASNAIEISGDNAKYSTHFIKETNSVTRRK
jgi:hypothetical protein